MAGRSADRFRFGLGKRSASGAEDLADAGVGDDDDDGAVVEGEAEELAAAAAADDDDDAGDANDVAVVAKRDRLRSSGYYTIFLPHQYLSYCKSSSIQVSIFLVHSTDCPFVSQ